MQERTDKQTMVGEWKSVALADAPVEIIDGDRGKNYPKQHDFLEAGFCLFLNAGNVTADGFNFSTCAFVSSDRDQRLGKGKLTRHDVVLTTRGTVGNTAHFSETVAHEHIRINSGMVILRASEVGLHHHFLYFVTGSQHFHSQVRALSTGSAQPQLPIRDIEKIEIPLPSLPEQIAIAHILGTLDDKIELNRRMNRTLEEMARAIFQDWFVDFGPTRAKMEGKESYLPPELWDMFPDELVDSELGEIPEGWQVKPLGKVIELFGGATPSTKSPEYWEGGTHYWATPKDLSALSSPIMLDTERKVTDVGLSKISSGLHPPGTLLLSSRAPIGYLAISEVPVAINQGFIAMPPRTFPSNWYMLHWCRASHDEIMSHANGSTFLEISKSNFRQIPMIIPGEKLLMTYDSVEETLFRRISVNQKESLALVEQRNELLPMLLSGELPLE